MKRCVNKMDENKRNKILQFFVGTPAYNNDKDYAAFASFTAPLNMFFLICLVLHTIYMLVFAYFRITAMQIFDIIAVILYAMFVILLKYMKGSWLYCILLTCFELFLHQICSVKLFGLQSGFQYLMIPLIFMTALIGNKGKLMKYVRNVIIFIASVTFICLVVFYNNNVPLYNLPYAVNVGLLIVNVTLSFIVTAIYTARIFSSVDSKRSALDISVDEKIRAIENMQHQIIISFANMIEARDGSTGKHVKRTSEYVAALVEELKNHGDYADVLTDRYIHDTVLSAPLHDIGKITVPDAILQKPGRLTKEEFEQIKNHTVNGKRIIEEAMSDIEDAEFLKVAKCVALYHHESWDGSGYPYGIEGEQIPLCARIMTIADYFDALSAKRVYKAAMPTSEVFQNIQEQRGKKFDPVVTDAFLRIREKIDEIAKANAD